MSLNTLDFTTLVRNQVAAIQGKASQLIGFSVGSVLRAMVETNAAVVLWLQSLILQVLTTTRAATSIGADLDSFVNDYGMTRLPAIAAIGTVAFSRFTATQQATVPIGAQVQTADGSQVFSVIADSAQSAYNSTLNAYVAAGGIASINVTVQAILPGSGGNAGIGAISQLASSIPGIDTVTNATAFSNGVDAETDIALRARFVAFLGSLSKATKTAIGNAVLGVQAGLTYALVENQDFNGTPDNGYFYVIVDDGSGNPPSPLLSTVSNAVDAARPVGTRFNVFGPTRVNVTVIATIATSAGFTHATVVSLVTTAITNYINSLTMGQALSYTRLAQIAFDASPGVTNVTGLQINGGNADITATAQQVLRAGTVTIS